MVLVPFAWDHFAGVLEEHRQHVDRLALQLDPQPVLTQLTSPLIEFEYSEPDNRAGVAGPVLAKPCRHVWSFRFYHPRRRPLAGMSLLTITPSVSVTFHVTSISLP